MTNADAIRQMTDEELYNFLESVELQDIDYGKTFCSKPYCEGLDCDDCKKWWLTEMDAEAHPQGLKYWSDSNE